jgi:hypothetical protein
MLHYLRIAVTALCLTACVLLIALWVRSYWWADTFEYSYGMGRHAIAASVQGVLRLGTQGTYHPVEPKLWREPVEKWQERTGAPPLKFEAGFASPYWFLAFPHWVPILFTGMVAILSWIRWSSRFSLRTLLIATTLVAVGLAVVVALI